MEVERLIFALEETISLLQKSEDSNWSSMSPQEIVRRLEAEIGKAKNLKPLDVNLLDYLFAPTGAIQEISIDNGWGTKFLAFQKLSINSQGVATKKELFFCFSSEIKT